MDFLENNLFKTYQLRSLLELGRLTEAWAATQLDTGREVVVKLIPLRRVVGQPDEATRRFNRIAETIARLEHPNLMPLLDYGRAEGYFYLVTPLVKNGNLQQRLQLEIPTQNQAIELALQVLAGLAHAHRQGVVHGQLSPASLWLDEAGQWRIDDFGEAEVERKLSRPTGELRTEPKERAVYLAPEQYQGQTILQSDLYAVGVVLYRLLSGVFPDLSSGQPAPLSHPLVLPALEKVLVKALQKVPDARFKNAEEMATAIKIALEKTQPRLVSSSPVYQTTRQTPLQPPELDKAKTKSFSATPTPKDNASASFAPQLTGPQTPPFELNPSGLFSLSSKPAVSATKANLSPIFNPENAVTAPYSFSSILSQFDYLEPEEQILFQFNPASGEREKSSSVPELTGLIFLLTLAVCLAILVVFLSF